MCSTIYPALPKVARACGRPPILEWRGNRDGTWGVTNPVGRVANHMIEDVLKQRRCGPFWCLPIVHRSGLLKRHTLIAGSADGSPLQAKADKANHGRARPRFTAARSASFGPGLSTARVG